MKSTLRNACHGRNGGVVVVVRVVVLVGDGDGRDGGGGWGGDGGAERVSCAFSP